MKRKDYFINKANKTLEIIGNNPFSWYLLGGMPQDIQQYVSKKLNDPSVKYSLTNITGNALINLVKLCSAYPILEIANKTDEGLLKIIENTSATSLIFWAGFSITETALRIRYVKKNKKPIGILSTEIPARGIKKTIKYFTKK